ncbi:MAG: protein kinase [Polyangiaceae bacterium]|nr:protein kinase [Polyangiaceae bacterium]
MKACPQCKLKYPSESTTCFVDGVRLVEITDPRIGTTLAGRYTIESVLGEGGMATVYRANHRLVDRPCAVKIMSASYAGNEVVRERFRREAKAAQKLAHPNIIEIFDQGETSDGSLFLVMELLEGKSLADVLEETPRVPLERAIPILIQIARALARAHDLAVIHRDLKPENIFVARAADGSDQVKLLDFGIARSMQDTRLTGAGEVFGTPQYMAPERITSTEAGPAADLYAVGVIMYEMLVGELPFHSPDITGWFIKHLKEQPPSPRARNPSLPEPLERLTLELLAKDPADRPVDAHRVHADLMAVAGAIGIRVPADVGAEADSESQPARTLPPVAIDRWLRRTVLFEQMLARSYPQARPPELSGLLGQVKRVVQEVTELRSRSVAAQRELEILEQRGREGRQRFGHAVDALGIDASKARDELKAAIAAASQVASSMETHKEALRQAHVEIIRWEGRSGFVEPYRELAEAYRAAAVGIDTWVAARVGQRTADDLVQQKRVEVSDLEFQIRELRAALAKQQEEIETELGQTQAQVGELGKRADLLEAELLDLATRFCQPLRKRPELGGLFQELESDSAA